jgi:hypothetical protein
MGSEVSSSLKQQHSIPIPLEHRVGAVPQLPSACGEVVMWSVGDGQLLWKQLHHEESNDAPSNKW